MKLSEASIGRIKKAFNNIDKNRDGKIGEKELLKFLKQTFPELNPVEADALKCDIMYYCDTDGDGSLNLEEFMETFSKEMGVFDAAVKTIARKLTKEEVVMLKDTFTQLDKNKDGMLDSTELRTLLTSAFPTASWEALEELKAMILSVVDTNHDGRLSMTEFIRSFALEQGVLPSQVAHARAKVLARKLTKEEVEQLKRTFQMIDLDHDGFISREELLGLLDVTFRAPKEVLEEVKNVILTAADKDGDGKLNLTEFIRSFAQQQGVLPAAVCHDRAIGLLAKLTPEEVEQLKQTFLDIDDNKDDYIDAEELTNLLTAAFPDVPADILLDTRNTILATADKNSDGKLNIQEFMRSFQEGQGVLPWHVPEATKNRMEAMRREREQDRAKMNHEPRLHHDDSVPSSGVASPTTNLTAGQYMANKRASKDEVTQAQGNAGKPGTIDRGANQSPLLQTFAQISHNDVSGCLIAEDQLREEFMKWDKDGNGFLDKKEFASIYRQNYDLFGEETDASVEKFLAPYGNMLGDNKISFEEFAIIMLRVAQK
eukprot:TRINITY_DN74956_c0_g1_i1.p1 TRINITY_DN74956_c0_g1~~TRINITY_DN74956_c0_g1_i1.p1  ORF type:complete len:542 (+),score=99.88 TRINITY_DN74956_c0_g1_i1:45-1670(+)